MKSGRSGVEQKLPAIRRTAGDPEPPGPAQTIGPAPRYTVDAMGKDIAWFPSTVDEGAQGIGASLVEPGELLLTVIASHVTLDVAR